MSHAENKSVLNDALPQPGLQQAEAGLLPPVLLAQVLSLQDFDLELLGLEVADPVLQEVLDLVEYLLPEVAALGLAGLAEAGLGVVVLPELVQDDLD